MSTGATNAEIASQLVVADGTAKTHVKRILRKLDARNRGAGRGHISATLAPRDSAGAVTMTQGETRAATGTCDGAPRNWTWRVFSSRREARRFE